MEDQPTTGIRRRKRTTIARTFGVREDDGHQSGAPVGDLNREIPHPELVHAHPLRPRVVAAGGLLRAKHGGRDAQRRKEQLAAARASHGRPVDGS